MAVDPALLIQAVNALRGKYTPKWSIDDVIDRLFELSPFDEMDEEDVEVYAEAALKRLATAVAPAAAPGGKRYAPGPRRAPDGLVPSAPFRFVTLPDQVAGAEGVGSLDAPVRGGYRAEIAVEWAAETPLLIGEESGGGVVGPMRLGKTGPHVIPGAGLRGMLRAAVEIVAHGRVGAVNGHHRYGLRDFEHPAYRDRSPVSRVKEVKAGWLTLEGLDADGDEIWTLSPCGWAHVAIDGLLASSIINRNGVAREDWIKKSLDEKYDLARMKNQNHYDFSGRKYRFSESRPDDFGRDVVGPGDAVSGTLVFSGKLPGTNGKKKFEYVFFEGSEEKIRIDKSKVDEFRRLYSKQSKNNPVADGSWKLLEPTFKSRARIPVFHVGDPSDRGPDFAFGLTRLFKIPHEKSVNDVIATQPAHLPRPTRDENGEVVGLDADFVQNLFGYVVERDELGLEKDERISPNAVGRKGRVAFSFAAARDGQETSVSPSIETVMMAPRASYAPFYLKSASEKDYSADPAPRLAGRKRYLPRYDGKGFKNMVSEIPKPGPAQGSDVRSKLSFLTSKTEKPLVFTSTIRLHNVTAAELGAVLFALTHGGDPAKPYRHMIGRARPFGAGQIRVNSARLSVRPNDAEAEKLIAPPAADEIVAENGLRGFCPPSSGDAARDAGHRPFLRAFAKHMRTVPGLANFPDVPAVREFLGSCDPAETAKIAKGTLDYMELQRFKKIRDKVKPERPNERARQGPKPPAVFPGERDGRLLPAPTIKGALPGWWNEDKS